MTLRNVKPILLTRVRCWVSSMTVSAEIAQMEVKPTSGFCQDMCRWPVFDWDQRRWRYS